MKNSILTMLAIVFTITLLSNCKKNEDEPTLPKNKFEITYQGYYEVMTGKNYVSEIFTDIIVTPVCACHNFFQSHLPTKFESGINHLTHNDSPDSHPRHSAVEGQRQKHLRQQ